MNGTTVRNRAGKLQMRVYRGCGGQLVTKDDDILSPVPSQRLYNHSPDGFNWGYGGSGPAQLALALLYDVTKDKEIALRHYQDFKWYYVARWGEQWQITTDEILDWLWVTNGVLLSEVR